MSMQVNKFMTMVVGLVVGVMLIAGVVTPVIANVSSDEGNDEGSSGIVNHTRYSLADANSDVSFYPVAEGQYSLQPESVTDRTVYDLGDEFSFLKFASFDAVSGEAQYLSFRPVETDDGLGFEGGALGIVKLSVVGNSLIGYNSEDTPRELVEDSLWYFTNPLGEMRETISYEDHEDTFSVYYETPYATEDSQIIMGMMFDEGGENHNITIHGSVGDNTVWVRNYTQGESATFTIEEGILTSVTVSLNDMDYTIPLLSGYDPNPEGGVVVNGGTFYVDSLILPVSDVGEGSGDSGSGSGSGISSTIKTTLSVIPLVMTVGLVLGAVAFFRMKN